VRLQQKQEVKSKSTFELPLWAVPVRKWRALIGCRESCKRPEHHITKTPCQVKSSPTKHWLSRALFSLGSAILALGSVQNRRSVRKCALNSIQCFLSSILVDCYSEASTLLCLHIYVIPPAEAHYAALMTPLMPIITLEDSITMLSFLSCIIIQRDRPQAGA